MIKQTQAYYGALLSLDAADELRLSKTGVYELRECQLADRKLKPRIGTAVDVGAHIGYWSLLLARKAANVYAFEPDPVSFALLKENIRRDNAVNCQAYPCAISDTVGKATLYFGGKRADSRLYPSSGDPRPELRVNAVTLDAFFGTAIPIDFLKVDTQGLEWRVLAGASRVLKSPRLRLLLEYWPFGIETSGGLCEVYIQQIVSRGFSILDAKTGQAVKLVQDLAAYTVKNKRHTNLWCEKPA